MKKTRLFTPGPTPLLPGVQLVMAQPAIHHRTPEFKDLLLETRKNLQAIYRTKNPVLLLASSGTGAMEAAVTNLVAPGEKALAAVAGKFGERWVEICRAHNIPCVQVSKEYGQVVSANEICEALSREPDVAGLFIQGCETSTATAHDLEAISSRVRADFPNVLIVVDAITTLGCQKLETDLWGLDVVIGGSQKAFALPPGLAFLALGPRALGRLEGAKATPGYYFDLKKELKNQEKGSTAFTPATSLVAALKEATQTILTEGLENVITEAELMARATRKGLVALGFRLLSVSPANAATAAFPPSGIGADELRNRLQDRFGIKVAGGQGSLKGEIIRIAHLGYFDTLDVLTVLSAIELCLREKGLEFQLGAGVQAALSEVAAS